MLKTIVVAVIVMASAAFAADIPTLQAVAATQPAPKQVPTTPIATLTMQTVTEAEKLLRTPYPADATQIQKDEELAKREAAMKALAENAAGRPITGTFTVQDVISDHDDMVRVVGVIGWKSRPIIDEKSAKKIEELKQWYKDCMKVTDQKSASDVKMTQNACLPKIEKAEKEAKQKADARIPDNTATVYMLKDQTKDWAKGQIKPINGIIQNITISPTIKDGVKHAKFEAVIAPRS